jgi:3-oxoacyl-[acyl-carrier protein] reductase
MSTLTNKIALVTGASKGIGAGIARHLAAAGATVAVNYSSSKEDADKVVAEIIAAGGKAGAIQGNFSKPEDIDRVFATLKQQYGHLDILVNNAGIYEFAPIEAVTPEHFHKQFDLNVLGLLLATKAAVAIFNPAGGSIINIGSVVGRAAMPSVSVYSATKGAVDSITVALSKEFGPRKIRVNGLNPGMVQTPGTEGYSDFFASMVNLVPLGRIGEPDDIGKVAAFLASDASFWITGQLINVSGGQ